MIRGLLLLALLAGCSQEQPVTAPTITGEIVPPEMRYICSRDGREAIEYTGHSTRNRRPEVTIVETGYSCDYREWRGRVETGPRRPNSSRAIDSIGSERGAS